MTIAPPYQTSTNKIDRVQIKLRDRRGRGGGDRAPSSMKSKSHKLSSMMHAGYMHSCSAVKEDNTVTTP